LDNLKKAKGKRIVQSESPYEPITEPTMTEAEMWVDNLIVIPSSICMRDTVTPGQAQPLLKASPHAIKVSSASSRKNQK